MFEQSFLAYIVTKNKGRQKRRPYDRVNKHCVQDIGLTVEFCGIKTCKACNIILEV